MPDYSSLLGTMGYDATSLQGLFGQYFKDPKDVWSQFLEPSFETAQTALGELPGMRRGLLGQLTAGIQERGVAAGRGLQARRAGAGFAGFGALDVLGRTTRGGLEREMGLGRYRIGEDIARKRAGVLGALSGKVGGFLGQLLAAGTETAEEEAGLGFTPITPGGGGGEAYALGEVYDEAERPLSYNDWRVSEFATEDTSYFAYQDYIDKFTRG